MKAKKTNPLARHVRFCFYNSYFLSLSNCIHPHTALSVTIAFYALAPAKFVRNHEFNVKIVQTRRHILHRVDMGPLDCHRAVLLELNCMYNKIEAISLNCIHSNFACT